MATRNIVPRGNGEGQLGTAEKHWAKLFADAIHEGANLGNNASLGYRQPSTTYTAGQIAYHSALPTGYYLECTTAGITSEGDITPSSTIGGTVSDGEVTWEIKSLQIKIDDSYKALYDCNEIMKTGFSWIPTSASNIPASFGGRMLTVSRNNDYGYVHQLYFDNDLEYYMYHRIYRNEVWNPWRMVDEIVAKSLTDNGYIKYASGLILQWGQTAAAAGTTTTITYPIAFSTWCRPFVVPNDGGSTTYRLSPAGYTNTTLTIKNTNTSTNISAIWLAIGY